MKICWQPLSSRQCKNGSKARSASMSAFSSTALRARVSRVSFIMHPTLP